MDELNAILELLMGKPGIIAVTTASFTALYQIWKIVVQRRQREIEQEPDIREGGDTINALVKVIEAMQSRPTNGNDRERVHNLLAHEQEFREDLMETIERLEEAKKLVEMEKKKLNADLRDLTSQYYQMMEYFNACKRSEPDECPFLRLRRIQEEDDVGNDS